MKEKHNNASLIMVLSAMNSNLEKLNASVMEMGQQLQRIDKHLFEIRLDNLRSRNHDKGRD